MKLTIEVSDARIHDLIHGHGLDRSFSWWHEISGNALKEGAIVRYDREQDDEGAGKGRKRVTISHVRRGLQLMAKNAPYQWEQFMSENDDMITCDVAWQYIIFGKEIYS